MRLLKCLCQTEEEKTVAWHSDARSLERQRIPREFTTKSRVVIISNDWQTLNKNVAALQDRGHVLLFQPTAVGGARPGGDVVRRRGDLWVVCHKSPPRARALVSALRARQGIEGGRHGLDRGARRRGREPAARLAAEILASPAYDSTAARVKAFVQQGGGCRATFFNYRRRLQGGGAATQG